MVKLRSTALVKGFRQSAPYINTHHGKTMVIMLGGEAIEHNNFPNIVNDIAMLSQLGVKIVLVYGARPQINQQLSLNNIATPYHKSVRITDEHALQIVKQVAGELQLEITARFSMGMLNTPMAGAQINMVSGNFVIAQPLGVQDGVDYNHSGRIRRIDYPAIHAQLNAGNIVLLGPIASSVTGECFNLSAEDIATQVAVGLRADKLIGFCSQQGIRLDSGEIVAELLPNEAEQHLRLYVEQEDILSGSARFLRGAIKACRAGVPRSHLISYKDDGSLIQELFSMDGIGTQIVMESIEKLRNATINDIGGILELIRPLEQEGILVRRSREQLEQEINRFIVIDRDSVTIGCAALYPFVEESMAEMACVAVHSDYRDGERGLALLNAVKQQAKSMGLSKLFVLTTHSIHWFREQGFYESDISSLPVTKQALYNFQRRSKILVYNL
uniref:amino-acid N-acetyltransferase n=1 Tax=Thaumasiovibrio occultus TaxID=1891184 RepID=UPI000B34C68F|nr:amino-acid N-acetyltransferase [Thaumasiovibrio occultus]